MSEALKQKPSFEPIMRAINSIKINSAFKKDMLEIRVRSMRDFSKYLGQDYNVFKINGVPVKEYFFIQEGEAWICIDGCIVERFKYRS